MSQPALPTRRELREQDRGSRLRRAHPSLARTLGITAVGLFIPGWNFWLAGKKKTGAALMTLVFLLVSAGLLAVLRYDARTLLTTLTPLFENSQNSLLLTIALALVGIMAFIQIIAGYLATRPRSLPWSKRFCSGVLAVLLACLAATPAAYASYYTFLLREALSHALMDPELPANTQTPSSTGPSAAPSPEPRTPWEGKDRINILLLGSDAGPDRTGTRPDVIMVASVDVETGSTALFTLPRNLQKIPLSPSSPAATVFPQGYRGEDGLLNSVWSWGEKNADLFPGVDNPGLQATQDAVEGALGLSIDYQVSVDMEGFSEGVDALGGVYVNVPRDLPIAKTGERATHFVKAGQNRLLNGFEALWYVRSRADSSDYDRMLRSRCMVSSIAQAISPTKLALKFPEFAGILKDHVVTNIPQDELLQWSELVTKVDGTKITSLSFTDDVIRPHNPDYEKMRAQVQELLAPTSAPTPDVVVDPAPSSQSPAPTTPPEAQVVSDVC